MSQIGPNTGDLALKQGDPELKHGSDQATCNCTAKTDSTSGLNIKHEGKVELLQEAALYMTKESFTSRQEFENIVILFFAKEMKELAEHISSTSQGRIVLGSVSLERFPNSFPNIFISHAEKLKWANVAFLASFHSPDVIFEQMSFIWMLPRYLVRSFKIILPFFPTGTQERIVHYGEVATAKTLAKMLSMTPLTKAGPTQIAIFDIHTLQNQFYFDDNVVPSLYTTSLLLRQEVARLREQEGDNVCLVYPDEGAHKRYHLCYKNYDTVICSKHRDKDTRVVVIKEGSCEGKHAVIIDDIVNSGGTLCECIKVCWANGASKVSCFVTHGVFENDGWKRFIEKSNEELKLTTFYVTDTNPITKKVVNQKPFKVLSISPLVRSIILESADEFD